MEIHSRKEIKRSAREAMGLAHPHACWTAAIYIVITTVLSYLSQSLSGYNEYVTRVQELVTATGSYEGIYSIAYPYPSFFGVLLILIIAVVTAILSVGFRFYSLEVSRHQKVGPLALMDGFGIFGKAFLLQLLIGIFVCLWSMLLIVPGVIAAYRYSMAVYLLHDHPDWTPMQCIRESSRIMKGNKGRLFVQHLSFIGWILLQCIPFVSYLVSVWSEPYMAVSDAVFYGDLVPPVSVPDEPEQPKEIE